MDNLSNNITRYYLLHQGDLAPDKKYHFASRLYLWCQDPACQPLLQDVKPWFTADNQPAVAIQQLIDTAKASPVHGSKNAGELRTPYFMRYPALKTYVLVLFRITFLHHMYGIDCRKLFFERFPRDEVLAVREALLQDAEAVAILSTHAINFLYLLDRFILEDQHSALADYALKVGDTQYNQADVLHLQLKIYLYTHCIIGETLFYYRKLPQASQAPYNTMLAELEALIARHFARINLDNKFEFLVCAKIAGFQTQLTDRIFDEAARSVSEDGTFLVDRHNQNPQADNTTLDTSEHRNVLFIMAHRDFTPLA